ncbi:MAG TPA: ABC transporter permease [Ktedonobacterales bacterium]
MSSSAPESQPTVPVQPPEPPTVPVLPPSPLNGNEKHSTTLVARRSQTLANGTRSRPFLPALRGAQRVAGKLSRRGNASVLQSFVSASEALNANRLRSLLTTLGIIIGVAAVIVMISISQGATAATNARLGGLGPNVLTILPGSQFAGGVSQGQGSRQTLTQADADAIASQVSNVEGVSPITSVQGQIIFQNQNYSTRVQGVYASYLSIGAWTMAEGQFFPDADEQQGNTVAVLGTTVVQSLFTPLGIDPVGQTIRIRTTTFTVVGVLAQKGASLGANADDVIYIPFSVAAQRLSRQTFVSSISVQASSADTVNQVQADTQQLLEQRHNIAPGGNDDFSIRNQNQLIQTVQGVATTLTFLLVGVAAVSLLVGGIGIMNIMLVSVTERTREIGIRSALGARRRDILSQFMIEAVVLSAAGGLIGIGLGVIAAIQVSKLGNLPELISPLSVMLAFGFSALIGILFGFYPAWRASRLDPIVALRVE